MQNKIEEASVGDVVHISSHKFGVPLNKMGTFNVDHATKTHVHVIIDKEPHKFNIKSGRGIGNADHLMITKGLREGEEISLEELSKATLGNYIKKSSNDKSNLTAMQIRGTGDDNRTSKQKANREMGIHRAVKKLTKESVSKFIDDLVSGNNVEAEDTFEAIMSDKVADRLETFRQEVAQGMFKESVEEISEGEIHTQEFGPYSPDKYHNVKYHGTHGENHVYSGVHQKSGGHSVLILDKDKKKLVASSVGDVKTAADAKKKAKYATSGKLTNYWDHHDPMIKYHLRSHNTPNVTHLKESVEELDESSNEYAPILKKYGFKAAGKLSDGGKVHTHPSKGQVIINKHGHWHHVPHGSTREDGFEGSIGHSLETHLGKLKD